MLNFIGTCINLSQFKEDLRKIGINLITAGTAGVFISHFVGTQPHAMLLASVTLFIMGL